MRSRRRASPCPRATSAARSSPGRVHVALELEIPSDVRYIERVVEIVATPLRAVLAITQRQSRLNIPVALSEALSNAILRGNGERTRQRVQVKVDVTQERLVLEVLDEGAGFDLEAVPPRSDRAPTTSSARTAAGCSS